MRRPRRSEPRVCACQRRHVPGLAVATRKTRSEFWLEPAAFTAAHLTTCEHSTLAHDTGFALPRAPGRRRVAVVTITAEGV